MEFVPTERDSWQDRLLVWVLALIVMAWPLWIGLFLSLVFGTGHVDIYGG